MDWVNLAEDRNQWRALVNTVMNLWVAQGIGRVTTITVHNGLHRVGALSLCLNMKATSL
jgi:hypothetical protein